MSVDPGWGGQRFIEASYERLADLAGRIRLGTGLEVDGGIGPATLAPCHRAGANLLAAGSAIYAQPSPGDAYRALVGELAGAASPA
jgi:ribulose-phosphate 3-epimerase